MKRSARAGIAAIAAVTGALVVGTPIASAEVVFAAPAGVACPNFGIVVDGVGGNLQKIKLSNGTEILAGTGASQTITNTATGKSITLPSNGSVRQTTAPNADGISTVTVEGHSILILFPTDIPAGPSTTLINGRVVFTTDAAGNFDVQSISGRTEDLCAALA